MNQLIFFSCLFGYVTMGFIVSGLSYRLMDIFDRKQALHVPCGIFWPIAVVLYVIHKFYSFIWGLASGV